LAGETPRNHCQSLGVQHMASSVGPLHCFLCFLCSPQFFNRKQSDLNESHVSALLLFTWLCQFQYVLACACVCVYVRLTNGRISRSKTKQKSAMHQSEFLFVGSLHYFDHMSIRCYSCQGLGAQNVNNVRRRKASMRNLICEDYLSIYRSSDRSIDLSIYRSIDLSIYRSIYLIYRSIICCSKSCSSKWYRKRN
jgi:hypothetical protein